MQARRIVVALVLVAIVVSAGCTLPRQTPTPRPSAQLQPGIASVQGSIGRLTVVLSVSPTMTAGDLTTARAKISNTSSAPASTNGALRLAIKDLRGRSIRVGEWQRGDDRVDEVLKPRSIRFENLDFTVPSQGVYLMTVVGLVDDQGRPAYVRFVSVP